MKWKRHILFAMAIAFLIAGGLAMAISTYVSQDAFVFRAVAMLLLLFSTYLARIAKENPDSGRVPPASVASSAETPRVSRAMWMLSALSVVGFGLTFLFLYKDALDGYHQYWPVYAFAGAGIVGAGVLGSLVAKLTS